MKIQRYRVEIDTVDIEEFRRTGFGYRINTLADSAGEFVRYSDVQPFLEPRPISEAQIMEILDKEKEVARECLSPELFAFAASAIGNIRDAIKSLPPVPEEEKCFTTEQSDEYMIGIGFEMDESENRGNE